MSQDNHHCCISVCLISPLVYVGDSKAALHLHLEDFVYSVKWVLILCSPQKWDYLLSGEVNNEPDIQRFLVVSWFLLHFIFHYLSLTFCSARHCESYFLIKLVWTFHRLFRCQDVIKEFALTIVYKNSSLSATYVASQLGRQSNTRIRWPCSSVHFVFLNMKIEILTLMPS